MKDWLMKFCPEIAEWQAEIIAEQVRIRVESEREACAKLCEEGGKDASGRIHVQAWGAAKAIRARGNI